MRTFNVILCAIGTIYLGSIDDYIGMWGCVICLSIWASGHD